jgi:cyclopropane fatty-acyl-phospholipid synthase-like methyltransferase
VRPADDPTVDYKALVRRGYDRCAEAYSRARASEPCAELDVLMTRLRRGARVLDLGCGAGMPVTRALARRCFVIGVDSSREQIRRARESVPDGRFVRDDLLAVDFPPNAFDAVVALFVIFHLPREEQPELLRRIHRWLRPGGHLLATVSARDEAPYTEPDFFGAAMYWTNFAQSEYERIAKGVGFTLLPVGAVGHGFDDAYRGPDERHPLLLARKGDEASPGEVS